MQDKLKNFNQETEVRHIIADILSPIADRTNNNYSNIRDL
jgi:hypothetical protein